MFSYRFSRKGFTDRAKIANYTIDFGDGDPITISELLESNPDMIVEEVKPDSYRPLAFIAAVIAILFILLALLLWPAKADAQDVCNHHVTSGLVKNLIRRGMAKGFYFGEQMNAALYGILVVWNPSCQRAIAVVVRTGPNGETFNFVTHYYISGNKGTNIKAALDYARQRVAAQTVWMRSAPPSQAFRFVPRNLDSPGYRPPTKVQIGEGAGTTGGGGAVGGAGIRRNEQD